MSQLDANSLNLLKSIDLGADGAIEKLHNLVRHEVATAAIPAFGAVIKELRARGIGFEEYGRQTEDEIHYRAPLVLDGEEITLVLALDIVITAGVIPKD